MEIRGRGAAARLVAPAVTGCARPGPSADVGGPAARADVGGADTPRFRLLGPPEVRSRDQHLWFRSHRRRAVFATLALNANHVGTLDQLVDVVWSDQPPPTARTQIHKAVSTLRSLLTAPSDRDGCIATVFPGYVLRCVPDELDAAVFDHEVRHGTRAAADGRLDQAARLLRAALGRWYGRALDGVPGLLPAAARLEDQRLVALEAWAAVALAQDRHRELVAELVVWVTSHPLRERLGALHMIALYRSGRRAEALQAYHAARQLLRDELALEPGEELRRVERAILTGAPPEQLTLERPWPGR